jgi:hypothetical protein
LEKEVAIFLWFEQWMLSSLELMKMGSPVMNWQKLKSIKVLHKDMHSCQPHFDKESFLPWVVDRKQELF